MIDAEDIIFGDLEESIPNAPIVSGQNKLNYDSYFVSSNQMNRKKRNEKYNKLVSQLTSLMNKNEPNLTYLADGSEYKLTLTIKCDEEDNKNAESNHSYVKKVQCWNSSN